MKVQYPYYEAPSRYLQPPSRVASDYRVRVCFEILNKESRDMYIVYGKKLY